MKFRAKNFRSQLGIIQIQQNHKVRKRLWWSQVRPMGGDRYPGKWDCSRTELIIPNNKQYQRTFASNNFPHRMALRALGLVQFREHPDKLWEDTQRALSTGQGVRGMAARVELDSRSMEHF